MTIESAPPPPTPAKRSTGKVIGIVVGVLVLGCCGLFAIGSMLGGGDEPRPTPTPNVQPLLSPAEDVTVEATEEAEATETERPTETNEPEATATEAPSETPGPTDIPPTTVPPTAVPPTDIPLPDLNPDEDRDCNEFSSQAIAQAYWNRHRNSGRPNPGRLDGNSNGVVCEDTDRAAPAAPPQPQPLLQPQSSRPCDTSLRCTDFGSKAEMLAWWNTCGRPSKYDGNGDGDPCESLR